MSAEFSDLCILLPEYELLQAVVEAGRVAEVSLESGKRFSVKLLALKGLVETRDGDVYPSPLGTAAVHARKAEIDGVAVFVTAADLAAAAALLDRPAKDP